jgi:uncharacterized membrane protein YkvA (DUF1232 family)
MGIKLSFELTDRDLRYFRTALKESREAVRDADEQDILDAIRQTLNDIRKNEPLPDFVAQRLPVIDNLVDMLLDDEWMLPKAERERVMAMFVYFSDPEDILPDDVPVIGYLDDVIIIELVTREMQHVRDAYDDFCRFRIDYDRVHADSVDGAIRRDRLDRKRQQLHQRMRRRSTRAGRLGNW